MSTLNTHRRSTDLYKTRCDSVAIRKTVAEQDGHLTTNVRSANSDTDPADRYEGVVTILGRDGRNSGAVSSELLCGSRSTAAIMVLVC